MVSRFAFGSLLLLSSSLVAPAVLAQSPGAASAAPPASAPSTPAENVTPDSAEDVEEQVEISTPGANNDEIQDIVVTGRNIPNVVRTTPAVVSVLSTEDIARTGEGDIAGALTRVTGLSVVGNGFVFVRGLGDRYSLALLNGSPLPSPEPLRRVVPLDIFPTSVIASSLVQKSFSVNYPGEFGGGVINLTTRAIPTESFLNVGVSGGIDLITTGKLGYTYDGSDTDFLGFDDGLRDFPRAFKNAIEDGSYGSLSTADRQAIAGGLNNAETSLLQRNLDLPMNFSADISGGTAFDIGDDRLGVIAAIGYSSTWRTRQARQQSSQGADLEALSGDYLATLTDNRVVVNGLLGLGYEFGEHKLRWTNLYIRDTIKQATLEVGYDTSIPDGDPVENPDFFGTAPALLQNTRWFERQLIDTQFVGEFRFDQLSIDIRGTYANSQREAPYERSFGYRYLGDGDDTTKSENDVDDYVNTLRGASSNEFARIAFSDLNEDVWAGGADLTYDFESDIPIVATVGYSYTDTQRTSSRYVFDYQTVSGGPLPIAYGQQRPDYLISDENIFSTDPAVGGLTLVQTNAGQGAAVYDASLKVHAGYGQLEIEDEENGLRATIGVRYEDGKQEVRPLGAATIPLSNDYWLPAATVTWNFADNMQLRLHSSKTIARPQFRELSPQLYQDFESNRQFLGNPFLQDSTLINTEARYEYYFARNQRFSLAGFYKKINNPIEPVAFLAGGNQFTTGFSNAPEAELYGAEVELQYYHPLDGLGEAFATRRLLLIGNYTFTKSKLKAGDETVVSPVVAFPFSTPALEVASNIFEDGAPLTGQSDHLVNVQIGIEDTDRLSQATLLFNYASERVTTRGVITGGRQPDVIEKPGLRIDFVAREEVEFYGTPVEIKFEARNLLGTDFKEFQRSDIRYLSVNSYELGQTFSLGASIKF